MSYQLLTWIEHYGYFTIFVLIFIQEVGIPNPIPNELVLVFSGFLVYSGHLSLSWILLSAIAGDLLASVLLYELFYFFGKKVVQLKPQKLPTIRGKIERLSNRLKRSGKSGIFIGRLTPFIKGYVSVICGLLRVPQKDYAILLLSTSLIWSSAYVLCGYFLGPYQRIILQSDISPSTVLLSIPAAILILFLLFHFFRKIIFISK